MMDSAVGKRNCGDAIEGFGHCVNYIRAAGDRSRVPKRKLALAIDLPASVSKIRLSRGALREFDHRNNQTEYSPSLLPKPTTTCRPGQDLHKINRFARQGGPSLAHLQRNVFIMHSIRGPGCIGVHKLTAYRRGAQTRLLAVRAHK